MYGHHYRPSMRRPRRLVSGSPEEMIFLLPTGVMVKVSCQRDQTLFVLKQQLWRMAKSLPLFNQLSEPTKYVLVCVNMNAEQEELIDETRQLSDVRYYSPIFKVVERRGDRRQKLINAQIGLAIGKSINDFESMRDQEVNEFRQNVIQQVLEPAVKERCASWATRAMYQFPPELEPGPELPKHVAERLNASRKFFVHVLVQTSPSDKLQRVQMSFSVDPLWPVHDLMVQVLKKKATTMNMPEVEDDSLYVLKIVGREEYLLGNHPLGQYRYLRRSIAKGTRAELALVLCSEVDLYEHVDQVLPPPQLAIVPRRQPRPDSHALSLWNINRSLAFKVVRAENLHVESSFRVRLHVGVYHGNENLCNNEQTCTAVVQSQNCHWNEQVVFSDLKVKDIPRSARLCCVIYTVPEKKKKGKRESKYPIAWVNMPLFDYQRQLRTGTVILRCWPTDGSLDDELNPIGTTTGNPHTDSVVLELDFPKYAKPVLYPSLDNVMELAAQVSQQTQEIPGSHPGERQRHRPSMMLAHTESKPLIIQLREIIDRDRLLPLAEQDKELLWRFRLNCLDMPHSLPKLLGAVKWSSSQDVAVLQAMIQGWPNLEPEKALELLDYSYADDLVRAFAVKCLEQLSDEKLIQYLLQLVQVLKYESYLDCSLVRFLLRRAMLNQRIGHYLFWYTRSEMHAPEVGTRFGLLLESYCRGSVPHLGELQKQVDALNRLTTITSELQSKEYEKKQAKQLQQPAQQLLSQPVVAGAICDIHSPLRPAFRLGKLDVEKVKVFDSKKRPLLLRFENSDPRGDGVSIIFKNGDDLRQDMLTLQLLRIMDNIWQQEGLDLRMIPYACLSTGDMVGMIEVVLNSSTVANIHKAKGGGAKGAFKKQVIWTWLQEHNTDEHAMDRAVENFVLSCAGYCVATFVLGIGDRHSDNIMVTKTGQLFHIDFGHFLGNFKTKLGVRRERVPFVLTRDFIHVITREKEESSEEFKKFREICENAFLILRRHSDLFVNLFAMMLSTGIPELRSLEDINYLRDMLAIGMGEKEAVQHFRTKMDEAINGSWSTSVNWWLHSLAKDNK